jgi:ribosomal protein L21
LSRGNVTTNADVNPAADIAKPSISKASIGEVVSMLNTLSPSILSISKLSGSKIKSFTKVLDQVKGKKVVVYHYKRKSGYHKKNGHRQAYTKVQIDKIEA